MVKWIGATWKRSFWVNDKHLLFECLLSSQDKYHTPAVEILIVFRVQNITAPQCGMGHVLVDDDDDTTYERFHFTFNYNLLKNFITSHTAHTRHSIAIRKRPRHGASKSRNHIPSKCCVCFCQRVAVRVSSDFHGIVNHNTRNYFV